MNRHPKETELALLAGGECGRVSGFFLRRHVRECGQCTAAVARFEILRADVGRMAEPDLDWNRMAAEMKANIRLGLEAGECVRDLKASPRSWSPRLGVAFASLAFLVVAGLTMKTVEKPAAPAAALTGPVLTTTGAGLELRDGASSIMLLTRGGAADQTVNADGEIGARSVENGTVTITNVAF
jgi:hypothetical protein